MIPAVSVVIPTYNRLPLLREAVDSVLSQSFPDFELIIVDDASTDGTADWLRSADHGETPREVRGVSEQIAGAPEQIAGAPEQLPPPITDPRVRPLMLTEHLGTPGAVRNRGVAVARAPLIAFLDSDDRWYPEKLRRQLPLHGSIACRISHTRELWIREGRTVSQKGQNHRRQGDIFNDALKKCIIGPSTTVIDRQLFDAQGGFDETLEVAEDYELWLRITAGEQVCYLDEPLTEKRAGPWEQLSEKEGGIEGFRIQALRALVDHGRLPPERQEAARRELARKLRIFALGARKRGREAEAAAFEAEAAAREPAAAPEATGPGTARPGSS